MQWVQKATNIFFPNKCIFCNDIIPIDRFSCKPCQDNLPFYQNPEKEKSSHWLDEEISSLEYRDKVVRALRSFKFDDRPGLAVYFAGLMVKSLEERLRLIAPSLICYVPMHPEKQKKRGYNQAELLANELAELIHVPCGKDVLVKTQKNREQHSLNSAERRENVKSVYALGGKESPANNRILLVDDIITTGATMNACAVILKEGGAQFVCGIAVAQTVKEN